MKKQHSIKRSKRKMSASILSIRQSKIFLALIFLSFLPIKGMTQSSNYLSNEKNCFSDEVRDSILSKLQHRKYLLHLNSSLVVKNEEFEDMIDLYKEKDSLSSLNEKNYLMIIEKKDSIIDINQDLNHLNNKKKRKRNVIIGIGLTFLGIFIGSQI